MVPSSEEDDESLTKMESEKDIGITTVIAQAEGMVRQMGVAVGVSVGIDVPGVVIDVKAVEKNYGVVQL